MSVSGNFFSKFKLRFREKKIPPNIYLWSDSDHGIGKLPKQFAGKQERNFQVTLKDVPRVTDKVHELLKAQTSSTQTPDEQRKYQAEELHC